MTKRRVLIGLVAAVLFLLTAIAHANDKVFVVNGGDGTVSGFKVEDDGTLTAGPGSPYASTGGSKAVSTSDGRFLYVTDSAHDQVHVYSVGADASLVEVAESPYAVGDDPRGLDLDEEVGVLYVANYGDDTVSAFQVGQGSLSPIEGSPVAVGNGPVDVATSYWSWDYSSAYVVNQIGNSVTRVTVVDEEIDDTGDWEHDFLSTVHRQDSFPTGNMPSGISIRPVGEESPDGDIDDVDLVYVTNSDDDTVTGIRWPVESGKPTPIAGSPFPTGAGPADITGFEFGTHVYVANAAAETLATYSVDLDTGALTHEDELALTGLSPASVQMSADGSSLHVANNAGDSFSAYDIGPEGVPVELAGSPFPAGDGPTSALVAPNWCPSPAVKVVTDERRAGEPVTFDASASSDGDGSIESYRWKFDDEIDFEDANTRGVEGGPITEHTFAEAGWYEVMMTATDNSGCAARVCDSFRIGAEADDGDEDDGEELVTDDEEGVGSDDDPEEDEEARAASGPSSRCTDDVHSYPVSWMGQGGGAPRGQVVVAEDGGTFVQGRAQFRGSAHGLLPSGVSAADVAGGRGYVVAAANGDVHAFGPPYDGGVPFDTETVGIAPYGDGYLLLTGDGGVYAFGDAPFAGSMHDLVAAGFIPTFGEPVGMTVSGLGYLVATRDGGVFAFGGARFQGSMHDLLAAGDISAIPEIVGIAAVGNGYVLLGADGGVFAFGTDYRGGLAGLQQAGAIPGFARPVDITGAGVGYIVLTEDGGTFAFGTPFHGSAVGLLGDSRATGLALLW